MTEEAEATRTKTESTRTRKLEEAQQIFNCECGKSYLTFSALYLHVKLKHGKRLTNKKNQNNHKVQEINNKKHTTYFLKQSTNNPQNQYNNQLNAENQNNSNHTPSTPKNHQQEIQQYLRFLDTQKNTLIPLQPHIATFQIILKGLMQYLQEIQQLQTSKSTDPTALDITFYYNEFATYYVPIVRKKDSLSSFKLETVVQVLYKFWKWLKENEFSSVELICSQALLEDQQK